MEKIELTFDQFAHLAGIISGFIGGDHNEICAIVEKALSMTEVPPEEILDIESSSTTIEDAYDEFLETQGGTKEESVAILKCIELTKTLPEFEGITLETLKLLNTDDVKILMASRKVAEISFLN